MRTWVHTYNGDGKIVHIDDISNNSADNFKCMSCGQKMSAKIKGQKKDKHFAHYNTMECLGETDLHKLARQYFVQVYDECLRNGDSYYVEYPILQSCTYCKKYKQKGCENIPGVDKFDLTKVFRKVIPQEKLKDYDLKSYSFIPDVLLLDDKNNEIFVEFHVSHPCSQEKINSGLRIIEFTLKEESDLSLINNKYIPYRDLNRNLIFFEKKINVGMYNFKSRSKEVERIDDCYIQFDILYVYKDGTTRKITESILEYEKKSETVESCLDIKLIKVLCKTRESHLHRKAEIKTLIGIFTKNPKYQNCRICSYIEYKEISLTGFFCKKRKKGVYPEDGLQCDMFKFFSKV